MTYKLGLIHDHKPPEVPDLGCFATKPIPTPPSEVAAPQTTWPMADNDTLGDCTIAGLVHVDQSGAVITSEPWTYPGDEEVSKVYLGLTGGQDTGLMLPQVLRPWHSKGLFGSKNGGYAAIRPTNTTMVKQGIWIFGAVYIAVDLPAIAQQQFNPDGSGIWELTHTSADHDIEGGHCVVPVGYDVDGNIIAVTWGSTVTITPSWWATYVVQCYAVVPPAFVEKGGDARGFDLHAIDTFKQDIRKEAA